MMKNVKTTVKSEFEVMDLEDLFWLSGIQIKFGLKGIELLQIAYIDSILSQFSLQDCNPTILPIDRGTTLTQSNPEDVVKHIKIYQSMIRLIMYLVTGTRPDLTFTISCLSVMFLYSKLVTCGSCKMLSPIYQRNTAPYFAISFSTAMFIARFTDVHYSNYINSR
jgi:hypothetical protein